MNLSTAIREGAKRYPVQAFRTYFTFSTSGHCMGACALGGAYAVATDDSEEALQFVESGDIPRVFPDIRQVLTFCPVKGCAYEQDLVDNIVAHLNDDHRWERESIADFVEQQGL